MWYNGVKTKNSRIPRVILGLMGGLFSDKMVECSHSQAGATDSNPMEVRYGKENNRQIHSRFAQGKRHDTTGARRKIIRIG